MGNKNFTVTGSYRVDINYNADIEVDTDVFIKGFMEYAEIENEEDINSDEFNEYIKSEIDWTIESMIKDKVSLDKVDACFCVEDNWDEGVRIATVEQDWGYGFEDVGSNGDQIIE